MRSFAITTSHCCLNRSVALRTCKGKDALLHLPAHFSLLLTHSPWTSTWQPFTPPEHLFKKQTNTVRSYWTHLGLSASAPGDIWKVIFSGCLSALCSVYSRHSGFWVQFELKSDRSCLHILFFYAFCICRCSDKLRVFVYSNLVICTTDKRGLQQYVFSTWLRAVNDKKLKIWNVPVRHKTLRWTGKYAIRPEVWKQAELYFLWTSSLHV